MSTSSGLGKEAEMIGGPLFWFVFGLLFVLVAAGARVWAGDRGMRMTWWRWLLAYAWYGAVLLSIAAPMTLIGENETGAGLRLGLVLAVICVILGVGLWRVLTSGRELSSR